MTPQDGAHIPLQQIRAAVRTIYNGLVHHAVYSDDEWDLAVTTVAIAHEQLGGHTRQHIYDLFAAADSDTHPDPLTPAILTLARDLHIAPNPHVSHAQQLRLPFQPDT